MVPSSAISRSGSCFVITSFRCHPVARDCAMTPPGPTSIWRPGHPLTTAANRTSRTRSAIQPATRPARCRSLRAPCRVIVRPSAQTARGMPAAGMRSAGRVPADHMTERMKGDGIVIGTELLEEPRRPRTPRRKPPRRQLRTVALVNVSNVRPWGCSFRGLRGSVVHSPAPLSPFVLAKAGRRPRIARASDSSTPAPRRRAPAPTPATGARGTEPPSSHQA